MVQFLRISHIHVNEIATIEFNPGSELLSDNLLRTPETSDNAAPGLASLLTYLGSQYIALVTLSNAIFFYRMTKQGLMLRILL